MEKLFEDIFNLHPIIKLLLQFFGFGLTFLLVFIYLIIFKMEVLEKFASKILAGFYWVGSGVQKKQISKDIRSDILKVSKEMSKEIEGIAPYDLKIKWIKDMDRDTFIENNKIIIKMNPFDNKVKNKVYALHQYIEHGLLSDIKIYFDESVIKSLDAAVVRKLLIILDRDGLKYFDNNYLNKILKDEENKIIFNQLTKLDSTGMLSAIFIKELIEKGRYMYPQAPDECLRIESRQFLTFLYDIANKEPGEYVNLAFTGEYFNVSIMIIAKSEVLHNAGQFPYIKRAKNSLNSGITTIYLLADSRNKCVAARKIAENLKRNNPNINEIKEYCYTRKISNFKALQGTCIAIYTQDVEAIKEIEMELSKSV
jgi:hypothetical protein